uniref:Uncharacterized protein n=1 Tax=Brassica oleracea TaxID=3712 RepID=A0A3P6CFD8_BRAOL|nr:unnamed protein product [Brassica oleracea]
MTVSMLFMLALFATCGDPSFPFLLTYHAQVTLSPRLITKARGASKGSLCSCCF